MSTQGNANMRPMEGAPAPSEAGMPEMMPAYPKSEVSPVTEEAMNYRTLYPEIYYKLIPYIIMACDVMDTYGTKVPTQQQVEQMADGIYDDVCKMYPDMADYMRKSEAMKDDPPGDPPFFPGGFRGGRGGYIRRRGLGRDLIETLLLAELLGRRRYFY